MSDSGIRNRIANAVENSIGVKRAFFSENTDLIVLVSKEMADALRSGRKMFFFGNGGSAADAQHLAAELVNRFLKERPAFSAIALTTDTSVLTCIANDREFDSVFSRQIEALGKPGDISVGISTSGNSSNVLNALRKSRELGLRTVGFLGNDGGKIAGEVDHAFIIHSTSTPRIQETHITLGHILCELIEETLYPA